MEKQSRKAFEILEYIAANGKPEAVIIFEGSQDEIAREVFGYKTRQALAQHLKYLREKGLIRTGRGFIEVTQKGLETLGSSKKLAFVLIKTRIDAIDKVRSELHKKGFLAFKVTGDRDIVAIVDLSRIPEILKIPGVEDTVTLVTLRSAGVPYYLVMNRSRK